MELILTGYIESDDFWMSESQMKFERGLLDNRNQPMDLIIASSGGALIKAMEICAMIQTHAQTTRSICCGLVASSATLIAMSADKCVMDVRGSMMIHNCSGEAEGTAEDMRKTADQMEALDAQIMAFYVNRIAKNGKLVNGDIEQTKKMLAECMKEERILSAQECLDMGLIDKIINCDMPKQVTDMSMEIIGQIENRFPKFAAKYPNFRNAYQPKEMENKQDKRSLWASFTNTLAQILGFKNTAEAQAQIETEPQTEPTAQTEVEATTEETVPPIESQQNEPEMTNEEMLAKLQAEGYIVQAPKVEEPKTEAQPNAELEALRNEMAAMKQQLFEKSIHNAGAGVGNNNGKSIEQVQKEQRRMELLTAVGKPFERHFKR